MILFFYCAQVVDPSAAVLYEVKRIIIYLRTGSSVRTPHFRAQESDGTIRRADEEVQAMKQVPI